MTAQILQNQRIQGFEHAKTIRRTILTLRFLEYYARLPQNLKPTNGDQRQVYRGKFSLDNFN